MAKITAPNRGYNGISAGVRFTDGVGETDDPGALLFFRRNGYQVDGGSKTDAEYPSAPVTEAPAKVWKPEQAASEHLGAPLRDAAIAPLPKDFLPPTNAGEADPHSGAVVSPGLHDVRPGPLVPGPVAVDDPKQQEAVETAVAAAVLSGSADASAVAGIADAARPEDQRQPALAEPATPAEAPKPKAAPRARRSKAGSKKRG